MCIYSCSIGLFVIALMMVIGWLPKHWQIDFETMASDKDKIKNDLLPSHSGLLQNNENCSDKDLHILSEVYIVDLNCTLYNSQSVQTH